MPLFLRKTYMDNNATTPIAPEVRRVMDRCMKGANGNASSLHTLGREAKGIVELARESIAPLLGCNPASIIFTSGGTEANNAIIKGVFGAAGGGHIVTSKIEHESILGACKQVEEAGGRVTYLDAGHDGRVSPNDVRRAITPDTVLVSIMHANNETGVLQPVAEIAAIAREAGVPMHTDAVQSFGKVRTLVDELGCEFLTLTAHKINGPKGVGAIYWRGRTKWTPLIFGGDQEHTLRAGTEAVHQIAGLGAAARLSADRMDTTFNRLRGLRELLVAGLRRVYPQVRINEAATEFQLPGTVNATFTGKEGLHILAGLDCWQVDVSIGSACTADRIEPSHVLLGMGRSVEEALSTVRISMGSTTTHADVSYFLRALKDVLESEPAGLAWLDPQHLTVERIRSSRTFLIDVRYPYERMLSPSIPGAQLWQYLGFDRRMKDVPRDKEVILMCGTGVLSFRAGYRLARSGHPAVRVVYGGYGAWRARYPDMLDQLREAPDERP